MIGLSFYIHLPFCKKKCHYCDFVSYAGKEDLIEEYVGALVKEIQSSPLSFASQNSFPSPSKMERGVTNEVSNEVRSIYFGGGTPTLLESKHFEKILAALTPYPPLPLGEGEQEGVRASEITIEANPGTADKAKLKALRKLGINRLSIGAQSFNNHHLKMLGRIHTTEEIFRFYDDARAVGFDNINLDLIFALPNQTLDEWKSDLQTATNLSPNHLSTYNLQIEEGTPLHSQLTTNHLQLPTEEAELAMYEHTIDTLTTAGYKHYEISNFAKPGYECQHNINYWRNGNYIGIGAGAHSHINGRRWANPDSIEEYLSSVAGRQSPVRRQETGDWRQETIFLGLRLLEGLPTEKFSGFEKEVAELIEDDLLIRKNNHYKLTRRGLFLGNLVFEKFV